MGLSFRIACAALALAAPGVGHATWHKASTTHFVIYADQKPERLRAYAEKLERFDQAVRLVRRMDDPPPGDGNRLTIFVLDGVGAVQKMHGRGIDNVYGFYQASYTGSSAFVPARTDEARPWQLKADAVFFHEYAHHLMYQRFDRPYPNWLVEGFAELFATAEFGEDGSVLLGTAPAHRAAGLHMRVGLTTREMLKQQPARLSSDQRESLYGRGWLLTHYLTFEPTRKGQLEKFMDALSEGQSPSAAASRAFGDLKQLDRELAKYLDRRTLLSINVQGSALKTGKIDIAPLDPGAAAVLPWRMMSKRGVNPDTAKLVVGKVRAVAARYPDDPLVRTTLAEAEYDAGNHKASLAAAEAVLKSSPNSVEALVYKGRSLAALAKAGDPDASHAMARQAFLTANRIDSEDPEPLFLFFQSYVSEGRIPGENAKAALHYASILAPQDVRLRFASALAFIADGKFDDARTDILPIAFNPHGGKATEAARAAIERIDATDAKGAIQALGNGAAD